MNDHSAEQGTTARADSPDGRLVQVSAAAGLSAGDVLAGRLEDGSVVLVQLHTPATSATGDLAAGAVLGTVTEGSLDRRARPRFSGIPVGPADPDVLATLQQAVSASTMIGSWLTGGGSPAMLRAGGFNRHTFLCGQSGSGKTYALGVLLERLLIDTELRVAVLDPNADFVRLREVRDDGDPADTARLAQHEVRVLRSDRSRGEGDEPLRLRLRDMPRAAQAALLQLDPLRDREEYNAFVQFLDRIGSGEVDDLFQGLRQGSDGERRLATRIENLGIEQWEVWAFGDESAADVVTGGRGVTVMDLGGFGSPGEPRAVALDLLETLWARREERVPTLLVIDEAHNLAGTDPADPLARQVLERLVQVAAEGRKYGIWLLLSSQRPSKIHPQVLSQCDNLVLMRMNSPDDIAELGRTFGFVPPSMLAASTGFLQGEMLLAGPMTPVPMVARVRQRLTAEGGSDVAVPLAPRP